MGGGKDKLTYCFNWTCHLGLGMSHYYLYSLQLSWNYKLYIASGETHSVLEGHELCTIWRIMDIHFPPLLYQCVPNNNGHSPFFPSLSPSSNFSSPSSFPLLPIPSLTSLPSPPLTVIILTDSFSY